MKVEHLIEESLIIKKNNNSLEMILLLARVVFSNYIKVYTGTPPTPSPTPSGSLPHAQAGMVGEGKAGGSSEGAAFELSVLGT